MSNAAELGQTRIELWDAEKRIEELEAENKALREALLAIIGMPAQMFVSDIPKATAREALAEVNDDSDNDR